MADDAAAGVRGEAIWMDGDFVPHDIAMKYKDQAEVIRSSEAWREVKKHIVLESNRLMFEKSKSTDDLFFGKAMLYNLDLLDQYLELLTKLK